MSCILNPARVRKGVTTNLDLKALRHELRDRNKRTAFMFVKKTTGPRIAALDDGRIISVADLPSPQTRWVASRKQIVVQAVQNGLISREDALRRYGLSPEEFDGWCMAFEKHGAPALKTTSIQKYRQL